MCSVLIEEEWVRHAACSPDLHSLADGYQLGLKSVSPTPSEGLIGLY
jgi:hypothetical protein